MNRKRENTRKWGKSSFSVADPERVCQIVGRAVADRSGGDVEFRSARRGKLPRLYGTFTAPEKRELNLPGRWRSKSRILTELADRWGLSRTQLHFLCERPIHRMSWRTADALLTRLSSREQNLLRRALFSSETIKARTEYIRTIRMEGQRLKSKRDGRIARPSLLADWKAAERLQQQFYAQVDGWRGTLSRARLGHLRVWDGILAFPQVWEMLRGPELLRLLAARYRAELELVRLEMIAYREMAPFVKLPRMASDDGPADGDAG